MSRGPGVWSTVVNGFGELQGTSMAAPHVAGAIALLISEYPGLTNDEVERYLEVTGADISGVNSVPTGNRLDILAALEALVGGPDRTEPASVQDLAIESVNGSSVTLQWTATGDDGATGTASGYDLRYSTTSPIQTDDDFANASRVDGLPEPAASGQTESFTVSGLPFETEVHFALRAYDELENTSALSNSVAAQTGDSPTLSVTPESMAQELSKGETASQTLTLSNTGSNTLDFDIRFLLDHAASGLVSAPEQVAARTDTRLRSEIRDDTWANQVPASERISQGGSAPQNNPAYRIDDGSVDAGICRSPEPFDMMWLNAFQTVNEYATITSISTSFGTGQSANLDVRLLLYNDPNNDGNPDDAELLTETAIVASNPTYTVIEEASIEPTPVSGVFFVAALVQEAENCPAPLDRSRSQRASWYVVNSSNSFDASNLSANSGPSLIDDAVTSGNWVLRADAGSGIIQFSPQEGTVAAGESQDIAVDFDATAAPSGRYVGTLQVQNNGSGGDVDVPVSLDILGPRLVQPFQDQRLTLGQDVYEVEIGTRFANVGDSPITYDVSSNDPAIASATLSGSRLTVEPVSSGQATVTVTASDDAASVEDRFTVDVNTRPELAQPIADDVLPRGTERTVDLDTVYTDPDGDALSYEATSSDTSIVQAELSGTVLTLLPGNLGTATVTLQGSDGDAVTESSFSVEVIQGPPQIISSIPDQVLGVEQEPFVVALDTVFSDPDGESLSFSAISSRSSIASVTVEGAILTVTAQSVGEASITVAAADQSATADLTFSVDVSLPPQVNAPIEDQIVQPGANVTANLDSLFSDPDTDDLTYEVKSSDESVVSSKILGGYHLVLMPRTVGTADLTVSASDGGSIAEFTAAFTVEEGTVRQKIYEEDFSGVFSDFWTPFGSPEGKITTSRGNPAPSFNNNGDENYASGAYTNQMFNYSSGMEIVVDMYVKNTAGWQCWISGSFGLSQNPTASGRSFRTVVRMTYSYAGDVCNNTTRGTLGTRVLLEDGSTERFREENLNDYLGEWHQYRIFIRPDRHVEFYIDEDLIYRTEGKISMDYQNKPILLGSRARYGRVNHDNLRIYVGEANTPPRVASAIDDQVVGIDSTFAVELDPVFDDPNGDPLTFSATSLQNNVAVSVADTQLDITGTEVGVDTVVVRASDGFSTIADSLEITVPNPSPRVVAPLSDLSLQLEETTEVDLASVFSDPNADTLTFDASSTDPSVASTAREGSMLTIEGQAEGTTTIVATAQDGVSSVTDTMSVDVEGVLTRTFVAIDGWNLRSLPMEATNGTLAEALSMCSVGYPYAPGSGYERMADDETLAPGRGAFFLCDTGSVLLNGGPAASDQIAVTEGWNIISPFATPVETSQIIEAPSDLIDSPFYGYEPGSGYVFAETLQPTFGYWVKAQAAGTLTLPTEAPSIAAARTAVDSSSVRSAARARAAATQNALQRGAGPLQDATRLILTDADERRVTLYLASDLSESDQARFALPPVPPGDVFDIRFEKGSWVESLPVANRTSLAQSMTLRPIDLQGVTFPVRVQIENAAEGQVLRMHSPAQESDVRLTTEQPSAVLTRPTDHLQVGAEARPEAFALKASYPNPARKRATIEYAVPEVTEVTITVYDLLGRRVLEAVRSRKEPGTHVVTLEASSLPSGTYFYRMRAGDFTATKRLTVVR